MATKDVHLAMDRLDGYVGEMRREPTKETAPRSEKSDLLNWSYAH